MKKILIFIIMVIILRSSFVFATEVSDDKEQKMLYNDIISTFLGPTIDTVISDYYKHVLKYPYTLGHREVFNTEIIRIERPSGYRSAYFIIEIEVESYVGAHNPIGKDRILVELEPPGTIKILKFEHLKDYELPEDYKNRYLNYFIFSTYTSKSRKSTSTSLGILKENPLLMIFSPYFLTKSSFIFSSSIG